MSSEYKYEQTLTPAANPVEINFGDLKHVA